LIVLVKTTTSLEDKTVETVPVINLVTSISILEEVECPVEIEATKGLETNKSIVAEVEYPAEIEATKGLETNKSIVAEVEYPAEIEATKGLETNKSIVAEVECTAVIEATKGLETNKSIVAEVEYPAEIEAINNLGAVATDKAGVEVECTAAMEAEKLTVLVRTTVVFPTISEEIAPTNGRVTAISIDADVVYPAPIEAVNSLSWSSSVPAESSGENPQLIYVTDLMPQRIVLSAPANLKTVKSHPSPRIKLGETNNGLL
jgi:hypothetical protein